MNPMQITVTEQQQATAHDQAQRIFAAAADGQLAAATADVFAEISADAELPPDAAALIAGRLTALLQQVGLISLIAANEITRLKMAQTRQRSRPRRRR